MLKSKIFQFLLLGIFLISVNNSGLCIPVEENENIPSEPIELKINLSQKTKGTFSFVSSNRTEVFMLFAPKTVVTGKFSVSGEFSAEKMENEEKYLFEMKTLQGSMPFYLPGQSDQDLPDEVVEQTLPLCGMPRINQTVKTIIDPQMLVLDVIGVEEKYLPFFKTSVTTYPEKPLKIGGSWQNSQKVPMPYDVSGNMVWCDIVASFSLVKVDRKSSEAVISIEAEIKPIEEKVKDEELPPPKVSGNRTGTLTIDLKTGLQKKYVIYSRTLIDFGSVNKMDGEENIEIIYDFSRIPETKEP